MECGFIGGGEPDECMWGWEDDPVKRDKNSAPLGLAASFGKWGKGHWGHTSSLCGAGGAP